MARRDMKAVLYLNNFWQWSGGMATYTSWSTGKAAADPDVTGNWNTYIRHRPRSIGMRRRRKHSTSPSGNSSDARIR